MLPLQFLSVVTLEGGLRVPIIMHPMPVSSVSGGDIFDCIQRGNIEECIHFVQSNRSILKQKGKLGRDTVQTSDLAFFKGHYSTLSQRDFSISSFYCEKTAETLVRKRTFIPTLCCLPCLALELWNNVQMCLGVNYSFTGCYCIFDHFLVSLGLILPQCQKET